MMTMHPPSLLPEDARPSWEETDVSSDDGAAFLAADSLDGAGLATDGLGANDEASEEDEALIGALFPGASFANAVPSPEQASPAEKAAPGPGRERAAKNVTAQVPPVFFMIGCQRSGSNWLRTMLSEREDLIAPHPPHIMRDFMPRLPKYGDLAVQANLRILVDHVCAFVERNQVQWLDLHSRPMKFKRQSILTEVLLTVECFKFKEKYTAAQEDREVPERVDGPYYLLAVFDAIMNAMTKANGKTIWMCKSMSMSQFHDLLLSFYGKERLRYIYLVRDPRDVCLSFMKTPVGDCHPYAIAKKWAKLQNFAARILHETPDLVHQVCYEEVLGNKEAQVAKVVEFMGTREVCRSMRRGSVVAIKSEKDVVQGAKKGREAMMARQLSYQFKNLARGDSFTKGQFRKWATEMKDFDLRLVESVAFAEMKRLGYEPHLIVTKEDRIEFTEALCAEYDAENKRLTEKMIADLAIENPDDLKRRQVQAAVLEKTVSEHYNEDFILSPDVDLEDALDSENEANEDKGFLSGSDAATFDFHRWPVGASLVGFQSDAEVSNRFELQEKKTLKLNGSLSITFAAASQAGYYPHDVDKANQDAFIAGEAVRERVGSKSLLKKKKERENGILFAVFDGHGPSGAECARMARESVLEQLTEQLDVSLRAAHLDVSETEHVAETLSRSYRRSSSLLETGEVGIDATLSGTTATSLLVTKDFLHTANVGDSRILFVERDSFRALTTDHTPDREDEVRRIEANGGLASGSRIWSKTGQCGTAFTRSIGDAIAKKLGVCADPECSHAPLPKSNAAFVLGSDGVFDFVGEAEVAATVRKYTDPADACRELIGKAWNRWNDSEERADDITLIIGHMKHSDRGLWRKLRNRLRGP